MRQNISYTLLHRVFAGGALAIIGGLIAFLAYLYFAFTGLLTGVVRIELTPDLLTNLQAQRFDAAVGRMDRRRSMPDISPEMPDPFDAPARSQ